MESAQSGATVTVVDLPLWERVYVELLASADVGDVITYGRLSEVLGVPFARSRGSLYRARREMGELRHRWLTVVPTVGYRVIEASEHLRVAEQHKRRGRRQMEEMIRVGNATDLTRLSPEQLRAFDAQARINGVLMTLVSFHEQRLDRIEEILRREGKMD